MVLKTYQISSRPLLHDLNGDSKNFELTFTVVSKDKSPFYLVVADQATLDSTPKLNYKKADGVISGTILADKNIYSNYFLVIKADKACEVTVKTVKKDIPPNLPPALHQRKPVTKPPLQPLSRGKTKMKPILLILVIGGGIVLLYYLYNQRKKQQEKGQTSTTELPSVPPLVSVPAPAPAPALAPPVLPQVSVASPSASGSGSLLSRLQNLPSY